jgi:hypothetical protein
MYVLNKGFVAAKDLREGDWLLDHRLQSFFQVFTIITLGFRNAYHGIARLVQRLVLPLIPLTHARLAMPVEAINFNGDLSHDKINAEPMTPHFGLKRYTMFFQKGFHKLFGARRSDMTSVTLKRTGASSLDHRRRHALDRATDGAGKQIDRAATGLGTILPMSSALTSKHTSTAQARHIDRQTLSTGHGTDVIPGGIGTRHGERAMAHLTDLLNLCKTRLIKARLTAINFLRTLGRTGRVKESLADGAHLILAVPLSPRGTSLTQRFLQSSWKLLTTSAEWLRHKMRVYPRVYFTAKDWVSQLPVYNLSVMDDPVYFAEGVLVHNCDDCLSLDGRIVDKNDSSFYDIQPGEIHMNCRCVWVEIMQTEVESIEQEQEAYDNRDPELRAGARPELPQIEVIPKRILDAIPLASSSDKYGIMDGAGLDKPILKKGSLAMEFAKRTGRI